MNKEEYLGQIRQRLAGLPQNDIEERLAFYDEKIDVHVKEGETEEEAIRAIGTVDEVVEKTLSEIPLSKLVRNKVRPEKQTQVWKIVLLICTFPIWLPLLIVFFVLIFVLFVILWSLLIAFYAASFALAVATLATVPVVVLYLGIGNIPGAGLFSGLFLVMAGITLLFYTLCLGITKGAMAAMRGTIKGVKSMFVGKGETAHE